MAFWQSILQTCQAWLIELPDIGEWRQAGLRKSSVRGANGAKRNGIFVLSYEMHGKGKCLSIAAADRLRYKSVFKRCPAAVNPISKVCLGHTAQLSALLSEVLCSRC